MKAMIFSAGLGTRLLPLTNQIPKALVKVAGKPMLLWQIEKLKKFGFNNIIINVHHFANKVIDYIEQNNSFGLDIEISNESELLLNTGGGLKFAQKYLEGKEPFLVYNVDIFTDIDLMQLYEYHCKYNPLATLAVKSRRTSRYLLFNEENLLCGWRNIKKQEEIVSRDYNEIKEYAFSGIHIINPQIFKLITEEGKFSIIDLYLRLSKNYKIVPYVHNEIDWYDLGKITNIKQYEKSIKTTN